MARYGVRACATALMGLGLLASSASASLVAFDNAADVAYADGWQTNDNGGFGWGGGWTFRNGGNALIPQPDPPTASFQGTFVNSSLGNNNPGGSDANADNDI